MTGEQLRELIAAGTRNTFTHYAKNINWPDEDDRQAFCEDIEGDVTYAVLRAIRAAGLVVAEPAKYTSDIDMNRVREHGLALVRVVQ